MIGTMRLIPPHGLRNNADGRFICFILHKRGFEKKKILVKVSFCKGKKNLKQFNKTNDITDILKQKYQQNS